MTGDMADDIACRADEAQDYLEGIHFTIAQGIWPTARGEVKIADMGDAHLRASTAKIKRENWRLQWLQSLEDEVNRRADQCLS